MAAPVGRTASALRALTSAARRPQRVVCCAAPFPRHFSVTSAALSVPPPSPASPSSASSSLRAAETGNHLYAPNPSTQHSFLLSLLSPLGSAGLPNPDVLDLRTAEKALTHKSGVDKGSLYRRAPEEARDGSVAAQTEDQGGRIGHNEKLAFVGRRVLRLHLTQHLFSRLSTSHPALVTQALTASSRSALSLDAILDTKNLGASVGRTWRLEQAMRWREVRGQDGEMTGLYKCRGSAVEAILGAVYTTQGIEASSQLFEQLVLPNLSLPRSLTAALSGVQAPSAGAVPTETVEAGSQVQAQA